MELNKSANEILEKVEQYYDIMIKKTKYPQKMSVNDEDKLQELIRFINRLRFI